MNEVPLTLENLQRLDFGKIGAAFNAELQHVVKDCLDRPHDDHSRSVSIKFVLAPEQDTSGHSTPGDRIEVGCEITSAVPKRRTQVYSMKPRTNGLLTFHPDAPADPEANLLYDKDDPSRTDPQEPELKE